MKILMINVVCGIRSTGRICTDLADALTAQGHTVKIAYGREEVPDKYKKYAHRIGTDFDVKLHGIRARLLDESGFGSKSATIRFIEWVKKFDPDVIHLHNIHGYYINIEVLFDYLRTCGKKIIWTLHDCWAFTGHSALCDGIGCEKWKNGCGNCPNLKEYPKSYKDYSKNNWLKKRKIFTRIPNLTIITPSKWLAGLVKRSFLKGYSVKVIHNGIDTSQFYPIKSDFRKRYNIEDKYVLLGVASSWNEMKGLSDYIKLAKMLDDSYRIVLVGLSKEQLRSVPQNMICIERTNSTEELVQIYSASDVLLNLSYCENYPTVNLEAIACGTPVITYDTGGSAESAIINGNVVLRGDLNAVISELNEHNYKTIKFIVNKDLIDAQSSLKAYLKMFLRE
ncbi:glycosyltransferase [Ruminococcus sp.]|uniref:glycosyltransferase n=1 Tax=Ruminococcus sp. TaxID=41978 RepID=UPI0025899047|nr:glycosyltransferase [Ruminococcus sp.]MCR5021185.1 glycosyltransferase [Ruminococcus sp.]